LIAQILAMDAEVESIYQERLQHPPAPGLSDGSVRNGATRECIEAFAIEPCWTTDDLVADVLGIAGIRQRNELACGRIHGLEAIRAKPCERRRE
jgi:hypothetical protein